jgi:hypothetical protein
MKNFKDHFTKFAHVYEAYMPKENLKKLVKATFSGWDIDNDIKMIDNILKRTNDKNDVQKFSLVEIIEEEKQVIEFYNAIKNKEENQKRIKLDSSPGVLGQNTQTKFDMSKLLKIQGEFRGQRLNAASELSTSEIEKEKEKAPIDFHKSLKLQEGIVDYPNSDEEEADTLREATDASLETARNEEEQRNNNVIMRLAAVNIVGLARENDRALPELSFTAIPGEPNFLVTKNQIAFLCHL